MEVDELRPGVHWVGAVDWDRRSFDELVPIPAGTTYNAYLVRGRERTALVDTVDPGFTATLLRKLDALGVGRLDYVVANHAEQDHSGSLPAVLARYPTAQVVASPEAKGMLIDLLQLDPGRVTTVEDGTRLPLGDRTLRFIHFPWVHWPETMVTHLEEDQVLFSCDLFGAHLGVPAPRAAGDLRLPEEAKRYYACIMMPYRESIARNLPRVSRLPLQLVAPSHGPVHTEPSRIVETYRGWVEDRPRNLALIPYVSMHESTRHMVHLLAEALEARGVEARLFNLADPDLGKLAMAAVDAATMVFGSPAVVGGAHPKVAGAAFLINALHPKTRWLSLVGSYGWGASLQEQLTGILDLEAELLEPVIVKGAPRADDLAAVVRLAEAIAGKHRELERPPSGETAKAAPSQPAPPEPGPGGAAAPTRYRCKQCGWVYDPARGDPEHGIPPGTAFADLPPGWVCPLCGVPPRRFKAV
jgi:flavorubredoxin/rubredoxin